MRNLTFSLMGALCGCSFGYLVGAFTAWDFNPGNWPALGRALCAILTIFTTLIATSIATEA